MSQKRTILMKINNFTALIWVLLASSATLCAATSPPDEDEKQALLIVGNTGSGVSSVIKIMLEEGGKEVLKLPETCDQSSRRITTTHETYALEDSKIILQDTRGFGYTDLEYGYMHEEIDKKTIEELNYLLQIRNLTGILGVISYIDSIGKLVYKKTSSGQILYDAVDRAYSTVLHRLADFFSDEKAIDKCASQSLAVVITCNCVEQKALCYSAFGEMMQSIFHKPNNRITAKQKALFRGLRNQNNIGREKKPEDYINKNKVIVLNLCEPKSELRGLIKELKPIPKKSFTQAPIPNSSDNVKTGLFNNIVNYIDTRQWYITKENRCYIAIICIILTLIWLKEKVLYGNLLSSGYFSLRKKTIAPKKPQTLTRMPS